jgi:hypothetical protein
MEVGQSLAIGFQNPEFCTHYICFISYSQSKPITSVSSINRLVKFPRTFLEPFDILTPRNGTDTLSRNVGNKLTLNIVVEGRKPPF